MVLYYVRNGIILCPRWYYIMSAMVLYYVRHTIKLCPPMVLY